MTLFTPYPESSHYSPEPRFAETLELTLADILTTEEQADRDAANVQAMREWAKMPVEGN